MEWLTVPFAVPVDRVPLGELLSTLKRDIPDPPGLGTTAIRVAKETLYERMRPMMMKLTLIRDQNPFRDLKKAIIEGGSEKEIIRAYETTARALGVDLSFVKSPLTRDVIRRAKDILAAAAPKTPHQPAFDEFRRAFKRDIVRAYIQPGLNVGPRAGMALSQPITQMALSSFHVIGESAESQGEKFPRVEAILNASKTLKNPKSYLYFIDPADPPVTHTSEVRHVGTFDEVYAKRRSMEEVTVRRILLEPAAVVDSGELDEYNVHRMLRIHQVLFPQKFHRGGLPSLYFAAMLTIDPFLMFFYNVSMKDIAEAIEGPAGENEVICVWSSQDLPGDPTTGKFFILPYGQEAVEQPRREVVNVDAFLRQILKDPFYGRIEGHISEITPPPNGLPGWIVRVVDNVEEITRTFRSAGFQTRVMPEIPVEAKEQELLPEVWGVVQQNLGTKLYIEADAIRIASFLQLAILQELDTFHIKGIRAINRLIPAKQDTLSVIGEVRKSTSRPGWNIFLDQLASRKSGISTRDVYELFVAAGFQGRLGQEMKFALYVEKAGVDDPIKYIREVTTKPEGEYQSDKDVREQGGEVKEPVRDVFMPQAEERRYIYGAVTLGINVEETVTRDDIDLTRYHTNDIHGMQSFFGLYISKFSITNEFLDIIHSISEDTNARHISVLFDVLFFTGSLAGITSTGIKARGEGPLVRGSLEKAGKVYIDAAGVGTEDMLRGVSSSIYTGNLDTTIGTGMVDTSIDPAALPSIPEEQLDAIEEKGEVHDIGDLDDLFAGIEEVPDEEPEGLGQLFEGISLEPDVEQPDPAAVSFSKASAFEDVVPQPEIVYTVVDDLTIQELEQIIQAELRARGLVAIA